MIYIIIILEGSDLVGKTSVAKCLSKITGLPQTSIWVDLKTPKPAVISVSKTLRLLAESTNLNIIFDRSFMSEYVYGAVLDRETEYIPDLIKEWSSVKDCHLFILTASEDILRRRFAKRGDDYIDIEKIVEINKGYKDLKVLAENAIHTNEIDTSSLTISEVSENICKILDLQIID